MYVTQETDTWNCPPDQQNFDDYLCMGSNLANATTDVSFEIGPVSPFNVFMDFQIKFQPLKSSRFDLDLHYSLEGASQKQYDDEQWIMVTTKEDTVSGQCDDDSCSTVSVSRLPNLAYAYYRLTLHRSVSVDIDTLGHSSLQAITHSVTYGAIQVTIRALCCLASAAIALSLAGAAWGRRLRLSHLDFTQRWTVICVLALPLFDGPLFPISLWVGGAIIRTVRALSVCVYVGMMAYWLIRSAQVLQHKATKQKQAGAPENKLQGPRKTILVIAGLVVVLSLGPVAVIIGWASPIAGLQLGGILAMIGGAAALVLALWLGSSALTMLALAKSNGMVHMSSSRLSLLESEPSGIIHTARSPGLLGTCAMALAVLVLGGPLGLITLRGVDSVVPAGLLTLVGVNTLVMSCGLLFRPVRVASDQMLNKE
eukprot:gnl/Dysnectes_brevis/1021_a1138_2809.p1 GENE.gnl/Dysnectes_brevis/1021_a1138_2809~~gnl/Dysnectes_brevis/1021_a1138_2809.p1  ORF type:complete len:478 (-),score=57.48 gnl/Dysnectes_brevis/1021_a1138_2809:1143-2417(-)